MTTIYPLNKVPHPHTERMVFLAGSIEQGSAPDWQKETITKLKDVPVTILNPRRADWDSAWKQDPVEGPFREQVLWELSSISKADVIFFYFAPGTISPISLLELGICIGGEKKVIVCCPPDFHRYGNVKITCEMGGVKVYENLNDAVTELASFIKMLDFVIKDKS